jgi:hypothetical protein
VKKPNTPQTAENKESETKVDEAESSETKSPQECDQEGRTTVEQRENLGEKLQVHEVSSSVEENKQQNKSLEKEENHENEPTGTAVKSFCYFDNNYCITGDVFVYISGLQRLYNIIISPVFRLICM